jgi:hypothetical protein
LLGDKLRKALTVFARRAIDAADGGEFLAGERYVNRILRKMFVA